MGGLLFMALIGLFVAMIVNIFLASSAIGWVISIIGVVLFTALTAYDVQRITRGDYAAFAGLDGARLDPRGAPPVPELHQPVPVPAPDLRRRAELGRRLAADRGGARREPAYAAGSTRRISDESPAPASIASRSSGGSGRANA